MLKDGSLNIDMEDEITAATVITHNGEVLSEATNKLLNPEAAK